MKPQHGNKQDSDHEITGLFSKHTHTFFLCEFKRGASIKPCVCVFVFVCVFAKFALSINMTCLLISAIIVCVVFVQEFANKQTDAIKHTRLQIINEEAKSRLVGGEKKKPTRTNGRREKVTLELCEEPAFTQSG